MGLYHWVGIAHISIIGLVGFYPINDPLLAIGSRSNNPNGPKYHDTFFPIPCNHCPYSSLFFSCYHYNNPYLETKSKPIIKKEKERTITLLVAFICFIGRGTPSEQKHHPLYFLRNLLLRLNCDSNFSMHGP